MAVPVRPFVLVESCGSDRWSHPAGAWRGNKTQSREQRGQRRELSNVRKRNTVQRTAARASQRSGYPSSPFATSLPRNRRSPEKRRSTHADADAATIPEQHAGAHTHRPQRKAAAAVPVPCMPTKVCSPPWAVFRVRAVAHADAASIKQS